MARNRHQQPPATASTAVADIPADLAGGSSRRAADNTQQKETMSFKLPDYWPDDLELWFTRLDSVFRRYKVTSSIAKFDCLMEKIPNDVLSKIRDIVRSVGDDTVDPYEQVRDRLVTCNKTTVWQQIYRIMDHPELGGSRPSVMMSSMLSHLPTDEKPGYLFLGHFMRRLPDHLREHLAAKKFDSPQEMAAYADELWDARNSAATVNAVGRSTSPHGGGGRRSSPARGRGKRSQTPAAKQPNPDGLCFYHLNYGPRANKCRPPCKWTEQGNEVAAGDN